MLFVIVCAYTELRWVLHLHVSCDSVYLQSCGGFYIYMLLVIVCINRAAVGLISICFCDYVYLKSCDGFYIYMFL